jgi:DNA-binding MarR family transcriptional regulator
MHMQQDQERARELAGLMRGSCLGVRVGRVHRLVTRAFEEALRPLGLSLPQLELLSALTLAGASIKPAELAELTAVERSTMSRNLAVLQERGWVAATESSPTGRSMAVAITPAGSRQLARADSAWSSAQHAILAALGADAPARLDAWIAELGPRMRP